MTELWESPFFGVTLTILAYRLGCGIQKKTGLVICNGLVLADLMIIAVLLVFRIPYEAYNAGGSLINLFLGPATVCLAVTIYSQIDLLKRAPAADPGRVRRRDAGRRAEHLGHVPALGLDRALTVSLMPKSVTTPIATAISEGQGGIVSLTVAGGDLHRHPGEPVRPGHDPAVPGAGSHGGGTGHRRLQPCHGHRPGPGAGETEGAMSGLAIGLCGIFTTAAALFFGVLL